MANVLIVYGTTEGHTAEIVERMREAIEAKGDSVEVEHAGRRLSAIPERADGIIVGGSVHVGKQDDTVRRFAKEDRARLEAMPSAFFQVCLNAADPDPVAAAANDELLEAFVAETGWRPARTATFAGMLAWMKYGFFKRVLMKRIVKDKLSEAELDTSRDVDYTDCAAAERFATEFAASLDGSR